MKTKKILSFALAMLMGVPLFAGCEKQDTPPEPSVTFTDVWTEGVSKTFSAGESYTVRFDAAFGGQNYIKLEYTSACGLDATMHFTGEGGKKYSERFFLSKDDTEFRQILDYYHENNFDKTLESIDFKCVHQSGAFELKKVSAAVHPIDFSKVNFYAPDYTEENMQLYIQGKTVKLGVNMKLGGAIDYLSSVNQGVALYSDMGNVYVGQSAKDKMYVEDDVNLINAHDTGRLVQQSFYGTKGDSLDEPQDDYECGLFDHDGNPATPDVPWPYNPVQGGDMYQNLSQLVDVQFTDTRIYIKVRPMDWAKSGSITPFYMEDVYEILEDPLYGEYVSVTNKSTDFSGYVHDNVRDQELPAFYGITPLGKLAAYKGGEPWTDKSISYDDNLGFWSPGTSANRFRATENWIAWLNEDDWGIGLYVPDVEHMLVGRNEYTVDMSNIGVDPSGAVSCTYTAPLGKFSMPTYDSFTYRYYLKLDNVTYSRALFQSLRENGAENGDIKKLEGRA